MSTAEEVIQRHAKSVDGLDILEFPAREPRRLIVNFSAMHEKKFDRWSWFFHEGGDEHDHFLFFKDESFRFYLGDEATPMNIRHRRYIERVMTKLNIPARNVYTAGSSMGGYAAIYYGFWLELGGAIAVNPQVDMDSARCHRYDLWTRKMTEAGTRWSDLDKWVYRCAGSCPIMIRHGRYFADALAARKLLQALEDRNVNYIREFDDSTEHGFQGMTKERMMRVIDYWATL